jgi:hypothetical protein
MLHPSIAEKFSLTRRRFICESELGLLVKEEVRDSVGLEGHTFLGFRFEKRNGATVPVFDGHKLLASAVIPTGKKSMKFAAERIYSLSLLSLHTEDYGGPPTYEVLRDLFHFVSKTNPPPAGMTRFPTRQDIEVLWSGLESPTVNEVAVSRALESLFLREFLGIPPVGR